MFTVKNISTGPRGFYAKTGMVMLDAGASATVEIADAEFDSADATGWFEMSADKPAKAAEKPAAKTNFKG